MLLSWHKVSSNVFAVDICPQNDNFDLQFSASARCFYLSEGKLSFYKARERCEDFNMTLASIDSQVKLSAVFRLDQSLTLIQLHS